MTPLELIDESSVPREPDAPRLGRRRDHSRDPEILDAALEVLSEYGYDGMTIEMVANRAKAGKATLYRRGPSKAGLVVDAVVCMQQADGGRAFGPRRSVGGGHGACVERVRCRVAGRSHAPRCGEVPFR